MYCNYCGKVIQDDAAVCAYCGIRVGVSVARKRLVRPRQGRKIAGVCLGFAEYFDIDVTAVRLVWLIASFMTGIGLISYPIAWIVMPEEPLLLAAAYSGDVNGGFQRDVNGHSGHVNKVGAQRRWDYNHARHLRD
ncbi:MAG TPA: PspC domain-containing protein [Candidatus Aquilonibacter sp.]|nr:PspC domain-containing protein [Candidatus Aquilonibacter sp.]